MKVGSLIGPITAHLFLTAYSQQVVEQQEIEPVPEEFLPVLAPLPEYEDFIPTQIEEPEEIQQENILDEDTLETVSVYISSERTSEGTSLGTSEGTSEGTSNSSALGMNTGPESSLELPSDLSDTEIEEIVAAIMHRRHRHRHGRRHGNKKEQRSHGNHTQQRKKNRNGHVLSLRQSHDNEYKKDPQNACEEGDTDCEKAMQAIRIDYVCS